MHVCACVCMCVHLSVWFTGQCNTTFYVLVNISTNIVKTMLNQFNWLFRMYTWWHICFMFYVIFLQQTMKQLWVMWCILYTIWMKHLPCGKSISICSFCSFPISRSFIFYLQIKPWSYILHKISRPLIMKPNHFHSICHILSKDYLKALILI